jgi:hypothetical protein
MTKLENKVDFQVLKKAVEAQFHIITADERAAVVRMDVSKDDMWDTYLSSFPEGSNPIYKERTEHDCQCCKSFIRQIGNIAVITDAGLVTLWDVEVPEPYMTVVTAMRDLMRVAEVRNVYRNTEPSAGAEVTRSLSESGAVVSFSHFHAKLPGHFYVKEPGRIESEARSGYDVFHRGLKELTKEALDTVVELCDQNTLYKGAEFVENVRKFRKHKREYDKLKTDRDKELYAWRIAISTPNSVIRIRNSAIGTLLQDLSGDAMDLDAAVSKYESVVAPTNYKRPTALVTKAMIKRAQEKVQELGYMDSLARRHAVTSDVSVQDVLFVDRDTRALMQDPFDELASSVADRPISDKQMDKVEEMPVQDFLDNVLPKIESMEIMFEGRLQPNLMTMVAPVNPEAKCMLMWPNNFSWSYNGDVTDSIKEKVKAAGGNVTGDFRASLAWWNGDDLDLHLREPTGNHIYYGNRRSTTGGWLDVDMNASGAKNSKDPVENICFPNRSQMREGEYHLYVNQYCRRSTANVGFTVEVEFDGVLRSYSYPHMVKGNVTVLKFRFSKKDGLKVIESLEERLAPKEIWGATTEKWHKVQLLTYSPNHWQGNAVGNKHLLFFMEGCKKADGARGFYNEFLDPALREHRKVFEQLGSKMRVPESDDQLSGLGFSLTQRNTILVKVSGTFTRTLKLTV